MIMQWYNYGDRKISTSMEEYMITQNWGALEGLPLDKLIHKTIECVFDFSFPFYSDKAEDLAEFKRMFVLNNYNRSIACETIGQFKVRMLAILTKRMPYYEQLYKTTLIEFDPLKNKVYTIDRNIKKDEQDNTSESVQNHDSGNTSQNSTSNAQKQDIHSRNPQVNFAGTDYASDMDRGRSEDSSNVNTNVKSDRNGTRNQDVNRDSNTDDVSKITGMDVVNPSELIMAYRKLIVNINSMLCDDLEELFSCFD